MERKPTFVPVVAAAIWDAEGRLLLQQCLPHKRQDALEPAGFAEEPAADGRPALVLFLYTCVRWRGEPAAREGQVWGWFTRQQAARMAMPPMDRALLDSLPVAVAG